MNPPISNEAILRHQEQLLSTVQEFFVQRGQVLSSHVRNSFLATPRHFFVDSFKESASSEWHEVNSDTLQRHLATLYRDDALGVFDDGQRVATISQPSLVLYMLQMLQLEPGMRVLEIGAGSGWNAALLGALVGSGGYVESIEIIPDLAARAARSIARLDRTNVQIRCEDAGSDIGVTAAKGAFDRVIFTTAAHDIPAGIHAQLRDGGLLLMILKCPGGGDILILFVRQSEVLVALESRLCEFISMTGRGAREEFEPRSIEDVLVANGLREKLVSRQRFSFGGRHADDFAHRTFPIRSFLAASEPGFMALQDGGRDCAFGVTGQHNAWVVILRNSEALCYGNSAGWDHFMSLMQGWVALGLPTMLSMDLCAYAGGRAPAPGEREWLMRRRDTDFVWSL